MSDFMSSLLAEGVYAATYNIPEQIASAAREANTKTAQKVITFAEIMEKGVAGVGPKLAQAHRELASAAQQAVVTAYDDARERIGRHSPPYRAGWASPNERYAGGALRRVLSENGFIAGDAEGIYYANTAMLDAQARQWARLNAGAGSGGGGGVGGYSVSWSNLEAAALRIEEPVRAGFALPLGRWFGEAFYPAGALAGQDRSGGTYQRRREDRSIRAEHWLEAGVRVIAEQLVPRYMNIYKEIYNEAKVAGGAIEGIVSRTVRPGTVSFRVD